MAIFKTEGVVIKSQNLRETSKLLTLYTQDFGKMKLVAKGSRSMKSRFGGSIDLLNHIAIVFYYKQTRQIQFLSQSEIIHSFVRIRTDLEKLALGLAICELIDKTEIGNVPNALLFKTTIDTLKGLNQCTRATNYFPYFVIKFLEIVGFKPNFNRCRNCGKLANGESILFKISKGGFMCSQCRAQDTSGLMLSPETVKILQRFQKATIWGIDRIHPSRSAREEIDRFLRAYMRFHLDGVNDLNALRFLAKIESQ